MGKHVRVEHPLTVCAGRCNQLRVKGQRLLRRVCNRPGREAFVQVDSQSCGFRSRIGPCPINHLQHQLFVSGRVAMVIKLGHLRISGKSQQP